MKTIVVGIDFTKADQRVLDEATGLARACDATLQLIHVKPEVTAMDHIVYVPPDPEQRRAEIAEDKARMSTLVATLEKEGLRAVGAVISAPCARGILAHAEKEKADVIVIGSHSRNLVERALLGSTADKVVRKSPVPVLIVPTVK